MSLVAEERKKEILDLMDKNGKVKVSDLAAQLDVSTETIRRHLDDLENENKLKKVYGGAIPVPHKTEPPHYERAAIRSEEKNYIGKIAAACVQDYDVIVIDEGSTPLQMIPYLKHKLSLTIMTCSIPALYSLIESTKRHELDAKIIFIGGEVSTEHLRISGPIAEKMMEDFFVNKAFIATDGVDLNHGVTSYDPNKALFTRKLIEQSQETYILADHSKIGCRTYVKMADLEDVFAVVSDLPAPEEWIASLNHMSTKWLSNEKKNE
ncbi:DeoR/GlpR family DNA-binding transcription regulator [Halobacillus salinarum]|uniref:DeoR/GlpR family DNA-binding transcription regulator n=1 Tax=Halobacillus salinarum TaxID=2932257 RepID=A0ABY4EGN5_9BACI|nr:DeoR/GlpR family DNA-binding transcription regulator [Halobacillus salinarum]UOQ43309.1 DeoR/GlpR family DNA-binding transcription regulator [Halobacillus salinarum]